jgi:hypothetical protein
MNPDQLHMTVFLQNSPHAPRLVDWIDKGRPRCIVAFDSVQHAQAFIADDKFTSQAARTMWNEYRHALEKKSHKWCGSVSDAAGWGRTVANPGDDLRNRVERCIERLDTVPTAFEDRPRRRTMRRLDEGDELDIASVVIDHDSDHAWSERRTAKRTRPVLRVALNAELFGDEGQEQLAWRGATALAIARKAEAAGADVEVSWITLGHGTNRPTDVELLATVALKRLGQFVDRDSLTAYCCHLASFRYFGFRLIAQLNPGTRMACWGSPMSVYPQGSDEPQSPHGHDIVIDCGQCNNEKEAIAMLDNASNIMRKRSAK